MDFTAGLSKFVKDNNDIFNNYKEKIILKDRLDKYYEDLNNTKITKDIKQITNKTNDEECREVIKNDIEYHQEELKKKNIKDTNNKQKIRNLRKVKNELQEEKNELQEDKDKIQKKYDELQEKINELQEEINELQEDKDEIQKKYDELQEEIIKQKQNNQIVLSYNLMYNIIEGIKNILNF